MPARKPERALHAGCGQAREAGRSMLGRRRSSRPWSSTSASRTNRRPSIRNGRSTAIWTRPSSCSSAGRASGSPALPGATLDIVRLPGRTPLILIEVPASGAGQRMPIRCCSTAISTSSRRWSAGPRGTGRGCRCIDGDKLYGRGGADDGYAMFGALTALLALARPAGAACALRRRDRGLRGIGQLRPAALHRPPGRPHRHARRWWSASIRAAAITTSCG